VTPKGPRFVGGRFEDGWVKSKITILGTYELAADIVAPVLKPQNEKRWESDGKIVFSLFDNETAISSFKGTVDGKFVLFKYSSKSSRLTLDLKEESVARGVHDLRVVAVDEYGNESVFEKRINY
jgi:hypothetical protein